MQNIQNNLRTSLLLIVFLWGVFALSFVLPINEFGIIPRQPSGLWGILFAPFLHANMAHLMANSFSLLIFSVLLASFEKKSFYHILFFVAFVGGALTWVIGERGIHIGASGVIFGLYGYLLSVGYFQRKLKYIFVSFLVLFLFGSMVFGVLPGLRNVSWESHLCGFLAGLMCARLKSLSE